MAAFSGTGASTTTTSQGLFKIKYADRLQDVVPKAAILQNLIKFQARIGKTYNQPVVLTQEMGFTQTGPDQGGFGLAAPNSFVTKEATVNGAQIVLRSVVDYESLTKSMHGKDTAYEQLFHLQMLNAKNSVHKRLEIGLLYGRSGIGVTSSSANASSTSTVVTLTAASWAAGLWAGMENATLSFYNGSSIVSSGADAIFTVSAVNFTDKKITVTGTATGISALDTSIAGGARDIYFASADGSTVYTTYNQEAVGLKSIASNTGTLFGVDGASYSMFRGNTYDVGSTTLTKGKLMAAISLAAERGLEEDVTVLVSPKTWSDLNVGLMAASIRDSKYSPNKGEDGYAALTFHSDVADLKVLSHPYVKQGDGFIFPTSALSRVGSMDVGFMEVPGQSGDYFHTSGNAACEVRLYSNQALFCSTPAKCVYLQNIVPSA